MKKKKLFSNSIVMVAGFSVLNIIMYLSISKFWIGGSSFLPMIGKFGAGQKLLFSFLVNMGVIVGSLIGSVCHGEFNLRWPNRNNILKGVGGGFLIGMGVTLAPGTCTTAFVVGIPMLSVSSFLSVAGIFIGGFISYSLTMQKCIVK